MQLLNYAVLDISLSNGARAEVIKKVSQYFELLDKLEAIRLHRISFKGTRFESNGDKALRKTKKEFKELFHDYANVMESTTGYSQSEYLSVEFLFDLPMNNALLEETRKTIYGKLNTRGLHYYTHQQARQFN